MADDDFESQVRLAEALVFASDTPVPPRALTQALPDGADVDAVMAALHLAPQLKRVIKIPRRLPRVAMETLAIIAYHQPVTRAEVEEIRGAALSQATLDALLDTDMIIPKGRRETPGRPTLWGTTPDFLTHFGLASLRDLPRREDLLVEPPTAPAGGADEP